LDNFSEYVYVHFLPVMQPWIHLPQFELDIHVPVLWSCRARNHCKCWCVHAIVPILWGLSHRIGTTHGHLSLRISATFKLWRILWLNHLYLTPDFLRRSQLKYGKLIDNHIADKKYQRMTSICCDLWTTKETYQKLLWYRYNLSSSFCKSFLNRVLSKFVFSRFLV
jgi:hypothetical protein